MTDVDPKKFKQLCEDMSDVKGALLGNKKYGQKGALKRLYETEERSWLNKHKIDKIWFYAMGAGIVLWGVFQGLQLALGG